MSPAMIEDPERCYRAMASKDARFDGWIIVGVLSTGIYCRPSCPVPPPQRRNVSFFPTAAAAQRAGLRACKRCRPDASPGSPEWDVRGDVVARAMRLIADGTVDRDGVSGLARQLAYSPRQLNRLLVEELGVGPLRLARAQRAETARTLIESTEMAFADVTYAAGFGSPRQFNETVQAVFAMTPTDLRRRSRARGERASERDAGRVRLRLPVRRPFAAAPLAEYLATRAVPGVEAVDGTTLRRTLRLAHGVGSVALDLHRDHVGAELELTDIRDLPGAVRRCRRLMDLDADPEAVDAALAGDPVLGPLVARTPGRRSPGSIDAAELLVRAVVGQQVSLGAARTVLGRLADRYGDPYRAGHAGLTRLFPTSEQLAAADPGELPMPGARGAALIAVAAALADGTVTLDHAGDRRESYAALVARKGIGPWTASYVVMRGLGDPDVLMDSDLGVRHALAGLGRPTRPREVRELGAAWSPWRSYATHHLWGSLP